MNTKKRWLAFAGAALTLAIAPLLMGPTGGVPSFLRLQSLGVNTNPSGTGNIAVTGTITGATNLPTLTASNVFTASQNINASSGGPGLSIQAGGLTKMRLCVEATAGTCASGSSVNDSVLVNAGPLRFALAGGTQLGNLDTSGNLTVNGGLTTGAAAVSLGGNTTVTGVMNATSDVRVNGTSVCQSSGTNCSVGVTSTTATGTAVGLTTAPTATFRYTKVGTIVAVTLDSSLSGTSNSTSFSATGAVPASMQPARTQSCMMRATDNGTSIIAMIIFGSGSTTATFVPAITGGGLWTGAGSKAIGGTTDVCTYQTT